MWVTSKTNIITNCLTTGLTQKYPGDKENLICLSSARHSFNRLNFEATWKFDPPLSVRPLYCLRLLRSLRRQTFWISVLFCSQSSKPTLIIYVRFTRKYFCVGNRFKTVLTFNNWQLCLDTNERLLRLFACRHCQRLSLPTSTTKKSIDKAGRSVSLWNSKQ